MREDVEIIEAFKEVVIGDLKDLMLAIPVVVPQSEADRAIIVAAQQRIAEILDGLEHAENVRELSRYLKVNDIVRDFDEESVSSLRQRLSTSARVMRDNLIDEIEQNDDDYRMI